MAQDSKIEWTHHTANLWHGCTKVHAGCDHCYAETLSKRWGKDVWGNDKPRLLVEKVWRDLAKFQKLAAAAGEMHRVFVGSMMDIFEKPMPVINSKGDELVGVGSEVGYIGPPPGRGVDCDDLTTGHLRAMFFKQIDLCTYPNLMFLLLTKRPSNINKYIPESWKENPPANVMFGTSPADQATADKLIQQLLEVNGRKFLSIEPMLSEINGSEWIPFVDWIICGGESGNGRRPFNADWARWLKDQCAYAGIPFFMKQMDKVIPIPFDLRVRQFPKMDYTLEISGHGSGSL